MSHLFSGTVIDIGQGFCSSPIVYRRAKPFGSLVDCGDLDIEYVAVRSSFFFSGARTIDPSHAADVFTAHPRLLQREDAGNRMAEILQGPSVKLKSDLLNMITKVLNRQYAKSSESAPDKRSGFLAFYSAHGRKLIQQRYQRRSKSKVKALISRF